MAYDTISPIALQEKERCIEMTEVLSRHWLRGRADELDIPCPPGFLLAAKMNVTVGHKAHVFVSHVHFCGSYPDGGTLGYQALRHGHTPKAEKEPTMGSVSAAFYVKVLLLHNKSSGQEAHSALRKYGC